MHTYDQLMESAAARLRARDSVQAMQLYAEAHKAAPSRKEPLVELALLFIAHEDTEGGIGFLEKALLLDGTDVHLRLNLALAHYDMGQFGPAADHLKEAVLLIQYIVASTRIDEMFGDAAPADIERIESLEKTGEQAIELLKEIAGVGDAESPDAETEMRAVRVAS